jgi:hypothetical protein
LRLVVDRGHGILGRVVNRGGILRWGVVNRSGILGCIVYRSGILSWCVVNRSGVLGRVVERWCGILWRSRCLWWVVVWAFGQGSCWMATAYVLAMPSVVYVLGIHDNFVVVTWS